MTTTLHCPNGHTWRAQVVTGPDTLNYHQTDFAVPADEYCSDCGLPWTDEDEQE